MKKLTSNKEVSEMSMFELAHNSCYIKDGKARYRDYDIDTDARELAIKLLDKYADIPNEFTCDDDFDEFIIDCLQYGTDSIEGLIALFYRNLWAMADLHENLKKYEAIGTVEECREAGVRLRAKKPIKTPDCSDCKKECNKNCISFNYGENYLCPTCNQNSIFNSEYDVFYKHCENCGQAIDWSDKDEKVDSM